MTKVRAIIIDDEPLARQVIKQYLQDNDVVEIIGECENGFDGFKQLNTLQPDLLFLDIMMPKLTGFEMLELVNDPPAIIFSTAFDEYAIKAFERNAVDYLLKPYSKERFQEAVSKAIAKLSTVNPDDKHLKQLVESHQDQQELLQRIAVRSGSSIHIIGVEELSYIEAMDDYVQLHTPDGRYLKQNTMKYYEQRLNREDFVRIHRSYILRVKEIDRLEPMGKDTHVAILRNGSKLSVSRSGYSRLREVLKF